MAHPPDPTAVRMRLLGSRTVEESGWRLKKAAGLVKLLALAPDHRLHRERRGSGRPGTGRPAAHRYHRRGSSREAHAAGARQLRARRGGGGKPGGRTARLVPGPPDSRHQPGSRGRGRRGTMDGAGPLRTRPRVPPAMEDLEGYESARLFTTPSPATTSAAIGRTSSGTIRAPVTSYDPTTATPAFRPVCAVRINAVQGEGPVPAGPEPYCGEERRTLAR
jgi:hypothetical protein